jgi:transcription initiation factor TFIIE subunit alpha
LLPSKVFLELARLYGGEVGESIVSVLLRKGEATDEDIAKALNMSVGDTRKVIYILNSRTIISSRMDRDINTGWITYYWYVPLEQVKGLLYNIKRRVLERLEKRLEYEKNNVFYWCYNEKMNCPKLTFNEAVDTLFRCPKCNSHLKPYDNPELIAALTWAISRLKSELESHFVR